MLGPHDVIAPGALLIGFAMAGLALGRLIIWVKDAPSVVEPWGAEIEHGLRRPDAIQVCHHCFTPCPPCGWFCEHCGCAVGPYNNLMPYIHVFSEGEVFRNGVTNRQRTNLLIIGGYVLTAMGCVVAFPLFVILLPFYLWRVFRNLFHRREEETAPAPAENQSL